RIDVAEDAERHREVWVVHADEDVGERDVLRVRIVYEEAFVAFDVFDDFGREPVQADAVLIVLTEAQRLAMLEVDHLVLANVLFSEGGERTVVENVAVLIDLYERDALVLSRLVEGLFQVVRIAV